MKLSDLRDLSKEDLLDYLGLESRKNASDLMSVGLGAFSAGILLGIGLGIIFAPKAGVEMRADLAHKFASKKKKLEEAPSVQVSH
jgi:hypothetical protein